MGKVRCAYNQRVPSSAVIAYEMYNLAGWRMVSCYQLLNFSLRSQTFCYTADFSTTFFYIYVKPRLVCTSYHKTTSKHPRIQEFWLYFAKKISKTSDRNRKSSPTQLTPSVPMACGNAYVKHFTKFPDFF